MKPADTPRILWIELTSKCPLDCVFCSRKTRRGAGEHMPYELFESLIRQVSAPRKFLLNYSGESTVYPRLIPAIGLARSTGAFVELVSALVNVADTTLSELSTSGLNRLTVSVHTTDVARFHEIYRYGSFDLLDGKLRKFAELCRQNAAAPILDLAFVAMDRNLEDLEGVARLAASLQVRELNIFPVMRRDEIPVQFPMELTGPSAYQADFQSRVVSTVDAVAREFPAVTFQVCNPAFSGAASVLGEVPVPYPGPLPPDARIYSCEQNPWETAHVLSNGDVVACEVLDKIPLGNLQQQSLSAIWHGEAYTRFRERYQRGEISECRACPWKRAYRPGAMQSEIIGARGRSSQLLHGWHEPSGEQHIWSSQQALAVIAPRQDARILHVSGILPPGPPGDANELVICCNETEIGRVSNPWDEPMPFGLNFEVAGSASSSWFVEFRTRHLFRPSERGTGTDQRDLGFALFLLTSKVLPDPNAVRARQEALRALPRFIDAIDGFGRLLGRCFRRRPADSSAPQQAGLSIIIPERDNGGELADCLASVQKAADHWSEPLEVIVIVSGSEKSNYAALQALYRGVRWIFSARVLDFCRAVSRGLRAAQFDWTYLLNSDVVLDSRALAEAGRHRHGGIFSIASQIILKDTTRFREETNWTTLFVENGLAATHDRIPESTQPVAGFYAGGGASLFQTRMLRRLIHPSVYHPFYWEDVEWGWRARKLGYRSLFCPDSIAYHTQRSTIGRHYTPPEIDRIVERNRFLFHLRNLTASGPIERVVEEQACSSADLPGYLLRPATLWKIACGRLWNHCAPVSDDEVLIHWADAAEAR